LKRLRRKIEKIEKTRLRKIEETKINLIQSNLIKKESLKFRVFKNLKLKTPNLKPINMNYLIKHKHMKYFLFVIMFLPFISFSQPTPTVEENIPYLYIKRDKLVHFHS